MKKARRESEKRDRNVEGWIVGWIVGKGCLRAKHVQPIWEDNERAPSLWHETKHLYKGTCVWRLLSRKHTPTNKRI